MKRGRREGVALVLALALLILIVPLAMTMFVRSHDTLVWHAKQESQKRALQLAQTAMVGAREALANDTHVYSYSASVQNGGMVYQVLQWSRGELTQPIYLCAAEGIYLGEERLLVSLMEVLPAATGTATVTAVTPHVVLEHDRQWIYSDAGGAALASSTQLAGDYLAKVAACWTRLQNESAPSSSSYVGVLQPQINGLPSRDAPNVDMPTVAASQFQ